MHGRPRPSPGWPASRASPEAAARGSLGCRDVVETLQLYEATNGPEGLCPSKAVAIDEPGGCAADTQGLGQGVSLTGSGTSRFQGGSLGLHIDGSQIGPAEGRPPLPLCGVSNPCHQARKGRRSRKKSDDDDDSSESDEDRDAARAERRERRLERLRERRERLQEDGGEDDIDADGTGPMGMRGRAFRRSEAFDEEIALDGDIDDQDFDELEAARDLDFEEFDELEADEFIDD